MKIKKKSKSGSYFYKDIKGKKIQWEPKKIRKLVFKGLKWMVFLFLIITTLWGCVQSFIIRQSNLIGHGFEIYIDRDDVYPNMYITASDATASTTKEARESLYKSDWSFHHDENYDLPEDDPDYEKPTTNSYIPDNFINLNYKYFISSGINSNSFSDALFLFSSRWYTSVEIDSLNKWNRYHGVTKEEPINDNGYEWADSSEVNNGKYKNQYQKFMSSFMDGSIVVGDVDGFLYPNNTIAQQGVFFISHNNSNEWSYDEDDNPEWEGNGFTWEDLYTSGKFTSPAIGQTTTPLLQGPPKVYTQIIPEQSGLHLKPSATENDIDHTGSPVDNPINEIKELRNDEGIVWSPNNRENVENAGWAFIEFDSIEKKSKDPYQRLIRLYDNGGSSNSEIPYDGKPSVSPNTPSLPDLTDAIDSTPLVTVKFDEWRHNFGDNLSANKTDAFVNGTSVERDEDGNEESRYSVSSSWKYPMYNAQALNWNSKDEDDNPLDNPWEQAGWMLEYGGFVPPYDSKQRRQGGEYYHFTSAWNSYYDNCYDDIKVGSPGSCEDEDGDPIVEPIQTEIFLETYKSGIENGYTKFSWDQKDRIIVSSWGEAWTHGPFYGMFVFPLAWLATKLDSTFVSISHGWSVFVGVLLIVLILRSMATLLTFKNYTKQAKMQDVQFKVAQINAKYEKHKGNPAMKQKKQAEIMSVYKKAGVNPMGSLGQVFITMPLFLAMWRIISSLPVYKGASIGMVDFTVTPLSGLFGSGNAAASFIYLLLLIAVIFTQFISFKLPTWLSNKRKGIQHIDEKTKAQMKKSNKVGNWMIVFFLIMSISIPTLLALYWMISGVFTVATTYGQHYYIEWQAKTKKEGR